MALRSLPSRLSYGLTRWRGHRLGRKLVVGTLVFCAVFIVLSVAARSWWSWRSRVAEMNDDLVTVDRIFQRQITNSLWEMDRDALKAQLGSMLQVGSVGSVDLRIFRDGTVPELMHDARPRARASGRAPSLRRTLTYAARPGVTQPLGDIVIAGDERVLWERLAADVSSIVLVQLLQSVLLAGLIMWMVNRLVTVHVKRIARHIAEIAPGNLAQPLHLDRPAEHSDELSLLEAGVNDLQRSLSDYLARQRSAERDLAAHRDRLSELVEERTLELRAANARLEELARRDPLTGLANRRHFDEVQEIEFRRATRTGRPMSVLLCDVDFFKRYNDTHGHAQGDACLRAVADVLRTAFSRGGELTARIGGEEFAVLLPGLDEARALDEAERVCNALVERGIPHGQSQAGPYVTLSIGVAQSRSTGTDSFDALLRRADQALYRAKGGGRNRVAGSSGHDAGSALH